MLQEQSSIDIDAVTGVAQPDNSEDVQEIVRVIAQGKALADLKKMKGWQLILDFIVMQQNTCIDILKKETDMKKIRRVQCQLQAFECLPEIIEMSILNAEDAQKRLEDFYQSPD